MVAAALRILETEGLAQFSTRAVCAIAQVTAPTLYHHFGSADGLLSAAMAEAFDQFLASKKAAIKSSDPVAALQEGWDDYVRFAENRPRLYAAMMSRLLHGADLPAARQGYAMLVARIDAIDAQKRLSMSPDAAAQFVWASANAAALLFVTDLGPNPVKPAPNAISALRETTIRTITNAKLGD